MSDPSPVLVVHPAALFTWEQHHSGGCRCVCAIYHHGRGDTPPACLSAAEPGLLIRVEADGRSEGPLPVCRLCYDALAGR